MTAFLGPPHCWLHTVGYAVQYVLITSILVFPLTIYQGFFREHQYELATQNFGAWFSDQMTGLMVGAILGSLSLLLIYTVIRKTGQLWWIWASVASVAFIFFTSFIAPVYVAPLFNEYQALEDGPIRDDIMTMARAKATLLAMPPDNSAGTISAAPRRPTACNLVNTT